MHDEPYAFSAYQRFYLASDCLRVELGIVNRLQSGFL